MAYPGEKLTPASLQCIFDCVLACFELRTGNRVKNGTLGKGPADTVSHASQNILRAKDLYTAKEWRTVSFLPILAVNLSPGQRKTEIK